MLIFLAAPLLLTGCAATQPVRGTASDPRVGSATAEVGQRFVDFRFVDEQNKVHRLGNELGDYTVIAFTRGDRATDRQALDDLQAMLATGADDDNVKLVGIAIAGPTAAGVEQPNVIAIRDNTGQIHNAYGAEQGDWLYVIGPDRKIAFAAPASRAAALTDQLKARVDQLSRDRMATAYAPTEGEGIG
jgi:peroxiredoxin